jgi:Protein of unknown function (DUF1499)
MMRRGYIRQPSFAARLAWPLAIFALIMAAIAILSHRIGALGTQDFLLVMITAFIITTVAFILSILGIYALWVSAAIGGRRSARALALTLPVMLGASFIGYMGLTSAPLSDISTDTLDPPHFVSRSSITKGENINEPPRLDRNIQADYYPNLTGRRYALPSDTITTQVLKQFEYYGWKPILDSVRNQAVGDWIVEANVTTPFFRFADTLAVRVTDEGNATYLDMRSAANFGSYDFGSNARRIEKFFKDLDARLSSQAQ